MKRIVMLIDGTGNMEGINADTNIAKLDPANKNIPKQFIREKSADGTPQEVSYHPGVATHGWLVLRLLGVITGSGVKGIIRDCYQTIVKKFEIGDEIYIFGFSRGAYAARALAEMIGAAGIQPSFKKAWRQFRLNRAQRGVADSTRIKCVGLWDTVRFIPHRYPLHDSSFGGHIDVGLHAVAVDEYRWEFVPRFWKIAKHKLSNGQVEQTWFSGKHENVGGSCPDAGLSDIALIWMIARVQALTGLEFDVDAIKASTKPNIDGEVYDSTEGIYLLSHCFPRLRSILSPEATTQHINEKVHWSVLEKRGRRCTVFGRQDTPYDPPNLPKDIPEDRIATKTPEEQVFIA
jgi:uncharacterized protein (DUF2235 family)